MNNDVTDLMFQHKDDDNTNQVQELLPQISEKIAELQALRERIEKGEDLLNTLKKEERSLSGKIIPELMESVGMQQITMSDGSKVKITLDYMCNITTQNQEVAYKWLEENDLGSIVKNQIVVSLKKEQDPGELIKFMKANKLTGEQKKSVHWKTMSSIAKQKIEGGEDFPEEAFGVFRKYQTKVN